MPILPVILWTDALVYLLLAVVAASPIVAEYPQIVAGAAAASSVLTIAFRWLSTDQIGPPSP